MGMSIGIVGLPNAGKSTLFNALTRGGAPTGDYPFTTIDPNVARVNVPDERLDRLAGMINSKKTTPETVEFRDIAGLVRGASKGEGLGNQFLAAIREVDAICHVVRCHDSSGVPHPEGRIDPVDDLELIETELMAADLDSAERRIERVAKQAKSGDEEAAAEQEWLAEVIDALQRGVPVREVPVPEAAGAAGSRLNAMTAKPMLYVANINEGDVEVPPNVAEYAAKTGAGAVAISARIEADLSEMDEEEAAEMRADFGIGESGLGRLIGAAWSLLGLIVFFTVGEKEAVAWALKDGSTAHDAAGKIHTDIADAFVRAEVIQWDDLLEFGGYSAAREAGKLRTEGRDYLVVDGDVITIKV